MIKTLLLRLTYSQVDGFIVDKKKTVSSPCSTNDGDENLILKKAMYRSIEHIA